MIFIRFGTDLTHKIKKKYEIPLTHNYKKQHERNDNPDRF